MSLGNDRNAARGVVVNDALLHIGGVGAYQRQPLNIAQRHQLVQSQNCSGCCDAGAFSNSLDQTLIGIKPEPAR
ncbi:hypothetical protein D9M69_665000 [compost metagenome]